MNRCKDVKISLLAFAWLLVWGCGMAENTIVQPKPPENVKDLAVGDESRQLDADVKEFVRGKYTIASARYFQVPGDVTWASISRSVQNQMQEKSIPRVMLEWYEPGIDFVETYPQGKNGGAFAVAMPKGTKSNSDKIVGYYVLSAGTAAKN